MDKPEGNALVSVILPVYNGERFLAEAIRSVLKQSYRPIEIILVDDGSTDATAQIAAGFAAQVHYLHQSNSGPAAARNLGIRMAKGEFIAFIDADDLWPDEKLAQQMRCFETFPTIEIVQGLIKRIKLPNQMNGRVIGTEIDYLFVCSNLGSMVMRRSVFEKIGYFEESLRFHEDTDFWLHARQAGVKIIVQRKLALVYRIHGNNLTSGKDIRTTGFLIILRRSIVRRRRSPVNIKEIVKFTFISELLGKDSQSHLEEEKEVVSWPLVSIILFGIGNPTKFLRAIESIYSQNYHPVELFILGSSTSQVPSLIQKNFDRVDILKEHGDLASGLNTALHKSKGEMIAFLDAEAEWTPGKMKTQVSYLLDNVKVGYVVGRTRQIILPDVKYPPDLIEGFSLRNNLGDLFGTLLVRRATFSQVGGFNDRFPGMEETDWLLRASDKGFHQIMLPDICLFRFVQPDSLIIGSEQMKAALLDSVRSSVHRKQNAHRTHAIF